jgi:hypothetical protein
MRNCSLQSFAIAAATGLVLLAAPDRARAQDGEAQDPAESFDPNREDAVPSSQALKGPPRVD